MNIMVFLIFLFIYIFFFATVPHRSPMPEYINQELLLISLLLLYVFYKVPDGIIFIFFIINSRKVELMRHMGTSKKY